VTRLDLSTISALGVQALRAEKRKHIPVVLTKDELKVQVEKIQEIYEKDTLDGFGTV